MGSFPWLHHHQTFSDHPGPSLSTRIEPTLVRLFPSLRARQWSSGRTRLGLAWIVSAEVLHDAVHVLQPETDVPLQLEKRLLLLAKHRRTHDRSDGTGED